MSGEVDKKIVNNIIEQVKSEGLFDEFRKNCLSGISDSFSYSSVKQRTEFFVKCHMEEMGRKNPKLTKTEARESIRKTLQLQKFFNSGIDKVLDDLLCKKKIEKEFYPQIERVAFEYLGIPLPEPEVVEPEPEPIDVDEGAELSVNWGQGNDEDMDIDMEIEELSDTEDTREQMKVEIVTETADSVTFALVPEESGDDKGTEDVADKTEVEAKAEEDQKPVPEAENAVEAEVKTEEEAEAQNAETETEKAIEEAEIKTEEAEVQPEEGREEAAEETETCVQIKTEPPPPDVESNEKETEIPEDSPKTTEIEPQIVPNSEPPEEESVVKEEIEEEEICDSKIEENPPTEVASVAPLEEEPPAPSEEQQDTQDSVSAEEPEVKQEEIPEESVPASEEPEIKPESPVPEASTSTAEPAETLPLDEPSTSSSPVPVSSSLSVDTSRKSDTLTDQISPQIAVFVADTVSMDPRPPVPRPKLPPVAARKPPKKRGRFNWSESAEAVPEDPKPEKVVERVSSAAPKAAASRQVKPMKTKAKRGRKRLPSTDTDRSSDSPGGRITRRRAAKAKSNPDFVYY